MGAGTENEPGGTQAGTPGTAPEGGSGPQGAAQPPSGGDRIDRVESKLDNLITALHSGSQTVVQDRLDGPGATADEVARQLRERDRERDAQTAEDARNGRIKSLEDRLAGMAEQPPEPPLRRVERFMGWRKS
jgi:hypothetical protein